MFFPQGNRVVLSNSTGGWVWRLARLFFLLGVMSNPCKIQELLASRLKTQTISCVLATLSSSMYAPIAPLAFVCVAFALKEPENKS
jgi:hypothetical protein